jgi:hypothetical protein
MEFEKPVAWLGGRDLLANLKYFALFALSSGKLDLRDWMQPEVFPNKETLAGSTLEQFWKEYQLLAADGEFWFDYIADSGDGMRATFSLGYLLLGEIQLHDGKLTILDTPERRKVLTKGIRLRRGAFLFVGGDTTYHVADYASLSGRFANPLAEAANQYRQQSREPLQANRPLFGIPGNHDYYDELDGFNRQFRKPITKEDKFVDLHGRNLFPQLRISGYERFQTCSYVAIELPFDWWFWGVDCEIGRLDLRQQQFFKAIRDRSNKVPRKLIVATPEPTTVEGRRALPNEKTAQAFTDLRLNQPFVYLPGTDLPAIRGAGRRRDLKKAAGIARHRQKVLGLNPFECRLDISGDIHHYARYWGEPDDDGPANYASVVSGGGGAAMSPTQVDVGEVIAVKKFPNPKESARVVNEQLFNPLSVISGGNVWAAGLVIALLFYLTAILSPEHSNYLDHFFGAPLSEKTIALNSFNDVASAAFLPLAMLMGCLMFGAAIFFASSIFERLTRTYDLANNFNTNATPKDSPKHLFGELLKKIRGEGDSDEGDRSGTIFRASIALFVFGVLVSVLIGVNVWRRTANGSHGGLVDWSEIALLGMSVILLTVTIIFARRCSAAVEKLRRMSVEADTRHRITRIYRLIRRFIVGQHIDYLPFWGTSLVGIAWVGAAVFRFDPEVYPWELGQAFIYFFGFLATCILLVGSVLYSAWLFGQSYRIRVTTYSYVPVIAYNVLAAAILGTVMWMIGTLPLRTLILDVTAILLVLLVILGCVALAYFLGNKTETASYRITFVLFGLWHAVLQLATPISVIWLGNAIGTAATLLIILLVANPFTRRLLVGLTVDAEPDDGSHRKKHKPRLILSLTWFALGILVLGLPYLLRDYRVEWLFGYLNPNKEAGLAKFVGAVSAALIGSLLSCFWLGWYFAISLLWNGHGNEAGSTARTEDYKQFIRFRVTEDSLTGYVIGVKHVEESGDLLDPRLIDQFDLKCRPIPASEAKSQATQSEA